MRALSHLKISGRVQGVGYRAWTAREAANRALDGWVRNCGDGAVEAFFAGEESAMGEMIQACRRGPAAAHVTDITELPPLPDPGAGFQVLPTAP